MCQKVFYKESSIFLPCEDEAKDQDPQTLYDSLPEPRYEGHTSQIDSVLITLEKGEFIPAITGEGERPAFLRKNRPRRRSRKR